MKQQVVIIHGGSTYETHEEYLEYINTIDIDLDRIRPKIGWKQTIQEKLGEDFDVFTPKLPNNANAQFEEWKIWFEKVVEKLDDNLILIGHSLGGIFLAKYLATNKLTKKIKSVILIAAPIDEINGESMASFTLPESLEKFSNQAEDIHLFYSEDDPLVPMEHAARYQEKLNGATLHRFEDKGHFNQEEFPELVDLLKKI